jgi:ABC-type antimicrobial peptide transport system permease subunit
VTKEEGLSMTEQVQVQNDESGPMSIGGLIGVLVGLLLGLGFCYLAMAETISGWRLQLSGKSVTATVTNSRRTRSRKTGLTHSVRYRFKVGATSYTHQDATGRKNLWASVTKKEYYRARSERTIQVYYLPSNPWNNQPVMAGGSPWGDRIAALVLGLIIFLPCLLILIGDIKARFAK